MDELAFPTWAVELFDAQSRAGGEGLALGDQDFIWRDGVLRTTSLVSAAQDQTRATFGFKWHQRSTFESPTVLSRTRSWLCERYGDPSTMLWIAEAKEAPVLLDAGCGAALSAIALFGDWLQKIRYVGVDISEAVEVARTRFTERGLEGVFLQCDLMAIPLQDGSVDVIFSEGVLHHTDSTKASLQELARLLKKGGYFMFYVYRRKGPIREFTDDYIREQLQAMGPEEAWEAMIPLTKLGKALGELNIKIDVPQDVSLLSIPRGSIDIQRLFYWHVFKAYYAPELSLMEMNHINFDWYAPKNAHRQSPEEVRAWCAQTGLEIEREVVEEAGITIIARKVA